MKKKITLVFALLSVLGINQNAFATLWDININPRTADAQYLGAGYQVGSATDPWRKAIGKTYSTTALLDVTGTTNLIYSDSGPVASQNLNLSGRLTTTSTTGISFSFDDSASTSYYVYMYSTSAYNALSISSPNATLVQQYYTQTAPYTDTTANYRVIKYLVKPTTGTFATINISATSGNLNAIQIDNVTVPEPGSAVLLGVGGLIAFAGFKRKETVS
jgi:hypothetical protein